MNMNMDMDGPPTHRCKLLRNFIKTNLNPNPGLQFSNVGIGIGGEGKSGEKYNNSSTGSNANSNSNNYSKNCMEMDNGKEVIVKKLCLSWSSAVRPSMPLSTVYGA